MGRKGVYTKLQHSLSYGVGWRDCDLSSYPMGLPMDHKAQFRRRASAVPN